MHPSKTQYDNGYSNSRLPQMKKSKSAFELPQSRVPSENSLGAAPGAAEVGFIGSISNASS